MAENNLGNFKILFGLEGIEKAVKNLDMYSQAIKGINAGFKEHQKQVQATTATYGAFSDNGPLNFLSDLQTRILKVGEQSRVMRDAGGYFGLFGTKIKSVYESLKFAFGPGALNIVMGLGRVIMTYVPMLGLIAVALFALSKIWQQNIGNIQGYWIQLVGRFSLGIAKLDISFRKFLFAIEPIIKAIIVPAFAFALGAVEGFMGAMDTIIVTLTSVANVLNSIFGPAIKWLSEALGMSNAVKNSFGGWGKIVGQITAVVIAIMLIVKVINILKIAWLVFNTVFLSSPIGWIVLGLMVLIGIFVILWNKVDWFRKGLQAAWKFLVDGFKWAMGFVKNNPLLLLFLGPIGMIVLLVTHIGKVKEIVGTVFGFIKDTIAGIFDFFKSIGDTINNIVGALSGKKSMEISAVVKKDAGTNVNNTAYNSNVTVNTADKANEASMFRVGKAYNAGVQSQYTGG